LNASAAPTTQGWSAPASVTFSVLVDKVGSAAAPRRPARRARPNLGARDGEIRAQRPSGQREVIERPRTVRADRQS